MPVLPTVDEVVLSVSADSDMSVIIETVLAEDLVDGSSTLISMSNKVKMMREPLSEYFKDVHFCRYETSLNGCSKPFYLAQTTAGTIMDTVPLETLNSVWRVPGKGYFQCEDVEKDRTIDRVSINPSMWFSPKNGIYSFRLTVTARLSTCSPIVDRRALSSPLQIIHTVTQMNLTVKTTNRSSISDKDVEKMAIGLGVGVPLTILFISGAGFYFKKRRMMRNGTIVPEWS
jgi:hypothetical protein